MIIMRAKETSVTIARLTLALVFVCATAWAETAPTTVTCKDGTTAQGGRGACRGHGGVDKTKTAGGESGAAAAAAEPAASATTVTCKDGTTSHGGRGACRGHGGVEKAGAAGASAPAAPPAAAAKTAPPPAAPAPAPHAAAQAPAASSSQTAKATGGGKAATDDPTGAIAKCHDGMYWHGKSHSGSCSHHGGVETWLDGSQKKP